VTPRAVTTAAAATGLLVAAAVGWLLTTWPPVPPAGAPLTGVPATGTPPTGVPPVGSPAVLPTAGVPPAGEWPAAVLPVGRLLLDGCGVAAVGLAVLGWLLLSGSRRDVETARAAAARAAVVVAGAWVAAAVLLVWLQAAEVAASSPAVVGMRAVVDYVRSFQPGAALLVTATCAVGYGVAMSRRAAPGLPAALAVAGLLPAPLTGHASSAPAHEVAVLSVAVHAGAAAVWVGGLGAILTLAAGRRALLAGALPRFSRIATTALVAVAASGVITATARLGSVAALLDTGYGRIVLAKAAILALLVGLGALVRRRVLPAVRNHRPAPLLALAGAELTLMAVALGLAAALTRATP